MSDTSVGGALRTPRAILTAAVTGFAVMAAELTGVRLLAPHFGDSAYVWTNVIGVILAAMAIGATLGGRLSASDDARAWPFRLLLVAGVLLALAPFVSNWLGDALLPDDLPLDAAMPALIRGSLVASALVFAPPLLLLAAVSPLLIVLLAKGGTSLGRAAGDVAAAGTIGSLLGTFVATHWLVPGFGCRISLVTCAVLLLLAGLLMAPPRRRAPAAIGMVLVFASAFAHGGPLRDAPADTQLLAERETAYQFLQVHAVDGRTTLRINEGLDSFHSLQLADSAFAGGAYYDWHAIAPLLLGSERAQNANVLSIGDAAGTLRQVYAAVHTGLTVDAVDIDAETMHLGDEFFTKPKATGRRFAVDGRLFLERSREQWDVIHVDAYAHQVYVPAHLASREFFAATKARLTPGGVLCCNVGALDVQDPVLTAIAATVRAEFEHVAVFKIPQSRNALLCARVGEPMDFAAIATARQPDRLTASDQRHWQDITAACAAATNWRPIEAGGTVLCDDRPELDELLFESYVETGDPRAATTCAGQRSLADAETTALQAMQRSDWRGALQAIAQGKTDSAYLRQLAGDARWYLRHLHSAVAEYTRGLQADGDAAIKNALRARIASAERELAPTLAAEAAASRNGWLALGVTVVGLALAIGCWRAA